MSGNLVGLKGARAVADAVNANAALAFADLRFNSLNASSKALLREVESSRAGLLRLEL